MIKADPYEGADILDLLASLSENKIVDDELTKGRIRTIYTQLKYGTKSAREIAEYYELPIDLIKDIGRGKVARTITIDLDG